MGVINIVQTVKQIHKSDVVLVKIGKFYHVYGVNMGQMGTVLK